MAANIEWIYNFEEKSKLFIWSHNVHISRIRLAYDNIGMELVNKYKEKYFALGFDFNKGSFLANERNNDGSYTLKKFEVNPLNRTFSKAIENFKYQCVYIPLNKFKEDTDSAAWLFKVWTCRSIGAVYRDDLETYFVAQLRLPKAFDGLIIVNQTQAVSPIDNNRQKYYNED
jgi:erythromycin esterase